VKSSGELVKIEIIRDLIISIEISVDSEIFLADKLIIKERMELLLTVFQELIYF